MDPRKKSDLELKSQVFKALGHPTRLCIVEALSKKEMCVNEITELIGADMSTVSKHLSILKNAHIITDDKRGNQVYYSVKIACVLNFLPCVENVLREVAEGQRQWLKK